MTIQQVEEQYPFCLVSDRRCERLASDDMPARGFILELLIPFELILNLRCQVLVNLRLGCCLLTDYYRTGHTVSKRPLESYVTEFTYF